MGFPLEFDGFYPILEWGKSGEEMDKAWRLVFLALMWIILGEHIP